MKFSALVTTFVLGLSSIAAAAPGARAPMVRDHRVSIIQPPAASPPVRTPPVARPPAWHPRPAVRPRPARWQVLDTASATRSGRNVIAVNARPLYSKLKLDVTRGLIFVDLIEIRFANGRTQRVELDRWLSAQATPTIIDLAGDQRHITQIVVRTKGRARGSYTVLGA